MEETIKKYDEIQLKELLKKLKDIDNFTGFKNGAFVYYLGKYEANLLINYIEKLESKAE